MKTLLRFMMTVIVVTAISSPGFVIVSSDSSEPLSTSTVDLARYTFEPYTVTVSPSQSFNWSRNAAYYDTYTDWGRLMVVGGHTDEWFSDWGSWWWGTDAIQVHNYNEYLTLQFFNGTYLVGRPFVNVYSNIYTILNNDEYIVYQRFAQNAALGWFPADQFNKTERLTIDKREGIMRLDIWVRDLGGADEMQSFAMSVVMPETFGGDAKYQDQNKAQIIYVDDAGKYAVAYLGYSEDPGIGPQMNGNNYTLDMVRDGGEIMHGAAMILVAGNTYDLNELIEDVGHVWNADCDSDDYDLITARSEVDGKFDCFNYCSGSMALLPSGTTETISVNGVSSSLASEPNPILNYQKHPVLLTFDDHDYYNYTRLYQEIINATQKYDWRWTLNLNPGQDTPPHSDALLEYYERSSWFNYGTQLEIGNHGWNHSGFVDYDTTYDQLYWCDERWLEISPNATVSCVLPANVWGEGTTEAAYDMGIRVMRLGVWYGGTDSTLTHLEDGVLVFSWHIMNLGAIAATPALYPTVADRSVGFGLCAFQSHQLDFGVNETGMNDYIAPFFSWVENNTELITLTMGQYYDLFLGNLRYETTGGMPTVDLSSCIDDHEVWLDRELVEQFLFVDSESGEPAPRMKITNDLAILYAEKGHIYEAVSVTVSPLTDETAYVWLKTYQLENTTDDEVEIEITQSSGECEFEVSGLYEGTYWSISVDESHEAYFTADDTGILTWTYDGEWSAHTVTFERVMTVSEQFSAMMPIIATILVLGIIFSMIGLAASSYSRRR